MPNVKPQDPDLRHRAESRIRDLVERGMTQDEIAGDIFSSSQVSVLLNGNGKSDRVSNATLAAMIFRADQIDTGRVGRRNVWPELEEIAGDLTARADRLRDIAEGPAHALVRTGLLEAAAAVEEVAASLTFRG